MLLSVGFIITPVKVNTPHSISHYETSCVSLLNSRTQENLCLLLHNHQVRRRVNQHVNVLPLHNLKRMMPNLPRLYHVKLSSGTISLLAPDSESAAWMALELSHERNDELIDVELADEW